MSYELSFSPEFFYAEGEPYDRSDLALNSAGKPISVYSAICMMPDDEWIELCKKHGANASDEILRGIGRETAMDWVYEANTCSNLTVPVRVWLDDDGDFTVEVWDER